MPIWEGKKKNRFWEAYIFQHTLKHMEMRVNRKFDFRQDWKFCWDLSTVISDNWLFRWNCVFSCATLYPSENYGFTMQPQLLALNMNYKKLLDKVYISIELNKVFQSINLVYVLKNTLQYYWYCTTLCMLESWEKFQKFPEFSKRFLILKTFLRFKVFQMVHTLKQYFLCSKKIEK